MHQNLNFLTNITLIKYIDSYEKNFNNYTTQYEYS